MRRKVFYNNDFDADSRRCNADLRGFYPRLSACNPRLSALKFVFIILFHFFIAMSGCAPVLIGGAAVTGAIVVAQDFATTSIDVSYQRAWNVANDEIKKIGHIDKSFQKLGEIKATAEGSQVKVKISKLTEKTVDIKVTARKNLLPNTELAQAILAGIIRNL